MSVGVLALQGCVAPHQELLSKLNTPCCAVKTLTDLQKVERLILPGGESTAILKLIQKRALLEPLKEFGQTNPIWGICAGAVLLAKTVLNPSQPSLGLMDISAKRNHYGPQTNSFSAEIQIKRLAAKMKGDFIRAPLLESCSADVQVLAEHDQHPVLLQQGRLLASAFHVELDNNPLLHRYFLGL